MATKARTAAQHAGGLLDVFHVVHGTRRYKSLETIFAQGDVCDAVMYIRHGRVQLTVTSPQGRDAVVGTLTPGAFFGEGALAGQRRRRATAQAMSGSSIAAVKIGEMRRRLREDSALSDEFRSHLLTRNCEIEADLIDQLFNGHEKRLACALLLLVHFDEHQAQRLTLPTISRDLLAEMIGAPRSTVDALMKRFRKLGFLERRRTRDGGLQVHCSMLSVLLHD